MVCPSKAVHTLCLAVLHRVKHARASYKHARAGWLSTAVLNLSTPVLVLQRHIIEFLCCFSWLTAVHCHLYFQYMWLGINVNEWWIVRCLEKLYGFLCKPICVFCDYDWSVLCCICLNVMIPWPSVLKAKGFLKTKQVFENTRDFGI